jgi:TatD DNase family protein
MIAELPKERIFTETDTPYLSPYKDIRENESSFIKESIKKISEIWKLSEKEVERIIENNFEKIFKIN